MNALRHILIVDGDATARAELGREIARVGYTVSYAGSAEAASLAMSRQNHPDIVLMEADLPDADGRQVVARLRRRGVLLPIILLADAATEDDLVSGLDAGADDYMVRPLRLRELAARLRAQQRLSVGHEDTDMQVGLLTFRPATRTAFHPFMTRPARLTEKEAALLARLCHAEGRPVSRQTLLREVWGYSPNVSSHTVETHIYRLRRKVEAGVGTPPIVLNEDGGYRLATHEPIAEAAAEEPAAPAAWAPPTRHLTLRALASVAG